MSVEIYRNTSKSKIEFVKLFDEARRLIDIDYQIFRSMNNTTYLELIKNINSLEGDKVFNRLICIYHSDYLIFFVTDWDISDNILDCFTKDYSTKNYHIYNYLRCIEDDFHFKRKYNRTSNHPYIITNTINKQSFLDFYIRCKIGIKMTSHDTPTTGKYSKLISYLKKDEVLDKCFEAYIKPINSNFKIEYIPKNMIHLGLIINDTPNLSVFDIFRNHEYIMFLDIMATSIDHDIDFIKIEEQLSRK